ncbi:CWC16 protein [Trinorchestia longiramus]|nr:CWC16 protein [Trinorchestia longiramus]
MVILQPRLWTSHYPGYGHFFHGMKSTGERKGVNKYYPPDYDPNKGGLNKFLGTHALRERARKLHLGILIIRFEMPYNIWCDGCENHIGTGVRYNAEKKKVGMYYTTPIYQFRMKCHLCDNHFEIRTDPANLDYEIISGARRQERRWDPSENDQVAPEDKAVGRKMAADAMFKLEHSAADKTKAGALDSVMKDLEDLQESRWADDFSANQALRQKFRASEKVLQAQQLQDARHNLNVPLLPPSADDARQASLLAITRNKKTEASPSEKRQLLDSASVFARLKPRRMSASAKKDIAMQSIQNIVAAGTHSFDTFKNDFAKDLNVCGVIAKKRKVATGSSATSAVAIGSVSRKKSFTKNQKGGLGVKKSKVLPGNETVSAVAGVSCGDSSIRNSNSSSSSSSSNSGNSSSNSGNSSSSSGNSSISSSCDVSNSSSSSGSGDGCNIHGCSDNRNNSISASSNYEVSERCRDLEGKEDDSVLQNISDIEGDNNHIGNKFDNSSLNALTIENSICIGSEVTQLSNSPMDINNTQDKDSSDRCPQYQGGSCADKVHDLKYKKTPGKFKMDNNVSKEFSSASGIASNDFYCTRRSNSVGNKEASSCTEVRNAGYPKNVNIASEISLTATLASPSLSPRPQSDSTRLPSLISGPNNTISFCQQNSFNESDFRSEISSNYPTSSNGLEDGAKNFNVTSNSESEGSLRGGFCVLRREKESSCSLNSSTESTKSSGLLNLVDYSGSDSDT